MKHRISGVLIRNLIVLLLFISPAFVSAQTLTHNNWYFGNSPDGIRFNRSNNTATAVTNQATPFGTGGSAVASDPATANLLFYTDGNAVYDACHMQMLNGAGLTANSAGNQPVAISAVPGQVNKYFIFTNTADFTTGGAISRSVVDMSQFGNAVFPAPAQGDVESPKNVAIPVLTGRSEGMIVVPHSNGTDFWLITHENGTQNYSATLIDAGSYGGTFNTTTTSGVGLPITVANFAYQPTLKKLAVAPQGPNTDALILNFDDTNGTFSFDRYIFNSGKLTTGNQSIYDIEWSATGDYLYLSRHGEAGINADLLQFDYNNTSTTLASILPAPVFRSYGIQIAPDSAIYHLYQATSGGPFLIGRLTDIDSVASKVMYEPTPFGTNNITGTQFPAFLPKENVNLTVSFTSIGTCQNAPTIFFPTVTPAADSLNWDFGDGNKSSTWSPIYTYQTASTFSVTLTAFYHGQMQTATQPVTINPFALQLQLVQDTTACKSEFPPPRGSSSPSQFQVTAKVSGGTPASAIWSNGDTGLTLTPDSAGYYYIVVTDASGCSAYAGVNVKEYGLMDQRANIWYFGNHAGIDFNPLPNPPVPLDDSAMDAPEGTSTISDRNGQVIFYTDGDKVYDRTHAQIATGIGGDPASSQSALIVPVPGDETLYYIFTTQAIDGTSANELRYSLFDLKQNGGLGAVVQQNILLFAKSTERITANGNWLIAHEYGNNTFRAYPITATGVGDPVYSSAGSDHSFKVQQEGEGYMKLGPGNNLAVALSNPGTSNLVELFTLTDSSGVIDNYRKIDLKEPNGQVYGIEFSPGGNKIFATLKGSPAPSSVYEYFIDSIGKPYFRNVTAAASQELGALQLGPDGQIYMAINGSNVLGTIQAVEDTTQISPINFSGFTLAGGTNSRLGLPNFTQIVSNAFGGPDFTFDGVCLGLPTNFSGVPTDAIDQFQWFFGDGGSDTSGAPVHTYATAKTYTVTMNLTNRCGLNVNVVKPVTIFPSPPLPTVPGAIALCNGPVVLNANSNNLPGYTYLWSDGQTTQTVTIASPVIISITNTDTNGCTSDAQTLVADNRPQVELGPDVTICEDNNTPALNALNPGATYAWTINGAPSSTSQVQAVDVTTPGVFTYEVTVTDPVTTCQVVDDKTYTINVSPTFSVSGTNPTTCNGTDGTISLQLNPSAPAGGPYSYFLTGPGGFNQQGIDQTAPTTVGPIAGQRAGTFSAIVSDQISGCTISQAFGLSDPATFTADFTATDCDPTDITVNITGGAPVAPILYTFTNGSTGQVVGPQASNIASMSPGAGGYVVEVHENNGTGCLITITKPVTVTPKVISFADNICADPATITANLPGAVSYAWTGPGIVSGGATSAVTVNASGSYQVTATTAAGCDVVDTHDIVYDVGIVPDFTQTDACASNVLLTASPSGSYTYRWFKGGVFQPSLLGRQISLGTSENGANYAVTVVNTVNGCTYQSATKPVSVVGQVTAALSATPACDDDQPFTLTATSSASGVSYKWFFNNNPIASETNATLQAVDEGTYKVEISKLVCTSSAQIQMIKAPIPVGTLPNRVIICDDPENQDPNTSQVDLDPGTFTGYNWFKNELTLGYTDQVFTADSEGQYKVDITNSFGCVASDETEVLSQCIPKLVAPNAFRPTSNQPANKEFSVFSFFITDDFQIFIYNRWGELVFQSNDRYFKWNGTYNNAGQALPSGSYAYVIKYVSTFRPELGVQEKHGGVALIR